MSIKRVAVGLDATVGAECITFLTVRLSAQAEIVRSRLRCAELVMACEGVPCCTLDLELLAKQTEMSRDDCLL